MASMGSMPDQYTVSVNSNHKIAQRVLKAEEEQQLKLAKQAYDLAFAIAGDAHRC